MSSLNKVTLIGNVGKDPEFREFSNGGKMCLLTLATSERWKDKGTGQPKENTEWHTVVITSDGLLNVCQYISKGSKLYVEGQLVTRKWQDKTGADRYRTEIQLKGFGSKLLLLDSKKHGAGSNVVEGNFQAPPSSDLDDEIPF